MARSRVVVTGGAGFIGSNLAQRLASEHEVIIVDNLSTGRHENIAGLLDGKKVTLAEVSITDLDALRQLFAGAEFVFHLAALPSVVRSVEDPLPSHQVNVTGTLNVLLAARDCGVKKVVFASSSSAYGDTEELPNTEAMPPRPQSPYAASKVAGEYYCAVFSRIYGLPTICLRYFNVYGPRQDPNAEYAAVIPRFVARMAGGKAPVIYGDGTQTRDFTFVGDVVEATALAAQAGATGVFNIGSGHKASVLELAHIIAGLLGSQVEPVFEPPRPGDVKHTLADINSAARWGYRPRYSLVDGLRETIASML